MAANHLLSSQHASKANPGKSFFPPSTILSSLLWGVVPMATVAACYLNSLGGDVVHDDIFAIQDNPDLLPSTPLWRLFSNDFWGEPMSSVTSHKSYRPLTVLSFRLNYMLTGLDSWSYHLFNVLLHWVVTLLFGRFCKREVFGDDVKSSVAMMIFATHPVHTEAVSGLVGRADILASLLFLTSLLTYFSSTRTHSTPTMLLKLLLSAGSGSAAMLCKEHGATVLGVCLAYDVLVANRNTVKRLLRRQTNLIDHTHFLMRGSILVLFTVVLLWLRIRLLHGHLPYFSVQDNPASFSDDHMTKALTYAYLAYFNLRLLLDPSTLCYDWQMGSIPLVTALSDARNLFTVIALLFVAALVWSSLRRRGRWSHAPLLGLLLLVVPFLPASNLLLRVGFVVAERILYIPSMGWCILVSTGVGHLSRYRPSWTPLVSCLVFVLLVLFSARTITRNPVWATRDSLFRSALPTVPNNAKVHFNYANYLKDSGRGQEAIPFYQTAIRLAPDHAVSHNNLGSLLKGKEAEFHFREAVLHNPRHYKAYYNLGRNLENQGNQVGAESAYRQSLNIRPSYLDSLMSLASLLAGDERRGEGWTDREDEGQVNRRDEGWALMKRALKEAPSNPDVHNNMGSYLLRTGQFTEAQAAYQEALQLSPHHTTALVNLARVHRHLGYTRQAEEAFRRALVQDKDPSTYLYLGSMLHNTGQLDRARAAFKEGLALDPNRTDLICGLVQTLLQGKEFHEVEVLLEEGLSRDPLSSCLHLGAGSLKVALGHVTQAIADLGRAAELSSDLEARAEALHMRGGALKDLDRLNEAEEKDYSQARLEYQQALILDPTNQVLKENMRKLERAAGGGGA